MRFNGEFWEGTNAATGAGAPDGVLTAGKLRAMMDQFRRDFPLLPSTKFDLFGHDLNAEAYELNTPDDLRPPGSKGRRLIVVPRTKIDWWASELRRHGADVRVEPRLPEPQESKP